MYLLAGTVGADTSAFKIHHSIQYRNSLNSSGSQRWLESIPSATGREVDPGQVASLSQDSAFTREAELHLHVSWTAAAALVLLELVQHIYTGQGPHCTTSAL